MTYEYDEMSRVEKVTPTQGVDYRTGYKYNKNGSLSQVTTYDGGTGADTDYSYNTTSGKLSYRDFPEESSQKVRTAYSYDSAGRLEYESGVAVPGRHYIEQAQANHGQGRLRHGIACLSCSKIIFALLPMPYFWTQPVRPLYWKRRTEVRPTPLPKSGLPHC